MKARKITDPRKKVTDPVMLAELGRQGINSAYVEYTADYGKRIKGKNNPYAKFYRDLRSERRFAVISQLPMVDVDGELIEAAWAYDENREVWHSRLNLFSAIVTGNSVKLICLSDQPDNRKKDDVLTFQPQLFLNGVKLKPRCDYPDWLEVDPENKHYHQNVLQWDCGICIRRLRIIEGRLLGSWVFFKDPGCDVKIRYNQSGDFRLKLGQHAVSDDEELITKEYFHQAIYPLIINDSATFYPDAHPEISSVDGDVRRIQGNGTLASLRDGAGTTAFDDLTYLAICLQSGSVSNTWASLYRAVLLFDTSGLPDNAVINAATLSVYGYIKDDAYSWLPTLNIYSANPASNTALVAADFTTLGTTPFCDTAITFADFHTGTPGIPNDWSLNVAGIAAISKTGISKFGLRDAAHDVADSPPTWYPNYQQYILPWSADKGSGYKPKLVVTYTEGETKISSDGGGGVESLALRELGIDETGSGIEQSQTAAVILSNDTGSGLETGGLLKSLFDRDEGSGLDSIKILMGKAGHDLRLHSHPGQVGIPHKEVRL